MRTAAFLLFAAFAGGALFSQAPAANAPASAPVLPPGPGEQIVASTCGQCHGLETVTSVHQSQAAWRDTVEDMNDKGAGLSDADLATVVAYLAKNFGPSPAADAVAAAALPPGPGRDLVVSECTSCHTLERVESERLSKDGWQGMVDDMIARGADLSPEDEKTVVEYLAEKFGKPANGNKQ